MRSGSLIAAAIILVVLVPPGVPLGGTAAQQTPPPSHVEPLHRPFDQVLDLYVRDGLVYYGALRMERSRLDQYIASLNVAPATYQGWSRDQQMAFWLNAYNAFVLDTVIERYPIRGKSPEYPASSIRQLPGAFDRLEHRAAGRTLTLDAIEKEILPQFREPRLYLALGRGAVGSGRLRSEAFTASQLERQLEAVAADFLTHAELLKIDREAGTVSVTPILSWRESEFVAAYDKGAEGPYAQRSAIERALVAFITPRLLPLEREFIQRNEFRVAFHPFDWRLNDLTGGRVD